MSDDPDTLFDFPCAFPIKVMGLNRLDFQTLVISLIEPHDPQLDLSAITARESRNGRYLSLTVIVTATSREQLDAIYQSLSDHDQVVMAL